MNTNFKRIAFLKKIPNVPKPNEYVILNKKIVYSTAMEAFKNGRNVLFLTTFVNPNTKQPTQNDLELHYGISSDVLGKIKSFVTKGKDTLCVVEVPFVTIDGLPMMLHLPYNDISVVEIMVSDNVSLFTEQDIKGKTLNKVVINSQDGKKLSLVGLDYLSNNTSRIVYEYGISELSILDMEYYESLETNLNKSPYEATDVLSDIKNSDEKEISNEDLIEKLANMEVGEEMEVSLKNSHSDGSLLKDRYLELKGGDLTRNSSHSWNFKHLGDFKKNEYDHDNHVMIDMETLSTEDNAVITEISLAQFRPSTGEIIQKLKVKFDIDEMIQLGFNISHSTLFDFWLKKQPQEAIQKVLLDDSNRWTYFDGWYKVFNFLNSIKNVHLWGKGSTFDLTKLKLHYKTYLEQMLEYMESHEILEFPKYYNERCVRTFLAIDPIFSKEIKFDGIKHESMSDVEHQIKQVNGVIKKYNLHIIK